MTIRNDAQEWDGQLRNVMFKINESSLHVVLEKNITNGFERKKMCIVTGASGTAAMMADCVIHHICQCLVRRHLCAQQV